MTTDTDIAKLSHSIYSGGDGFTQYYSEEGFSICCGVLLNKDENIIIFRGTVPTEFQNWLQDLAAVPRPFPHSVFGPVHPGSFCGMTEIMARISLLLNPSLPTTIGGHSLGGQRAQEALAIMLSQYQPNPNMLRLVSIAGPAAGYSQFINYIAPVQKKILYRNAGNFEGDPVPLLPPLPYKNLKRTHVNALPGGWVEDMDPVLWHNSELYIKGIQAYELAIQPK
jgi:predicted lipase